MPQQLYIKVLIHIIHFYIETFTSVEVVGRLFRRVRFWFSAYSDNLRRNAVGTSAYSRRNRIIYPISKLLTESNMETYINKCLLLNRTSKNSYLMSSALCSSAEMFGRSPHQIRFVMRRLNAIPSSGFALKQAEIQRTQNKSTITIFVCNK
jgi:hypothetical protein